MDKTQKDNERIQKWYNDAEQINKKYHIEAYPTFVFLSPNGDLVYRENGFKNVGELAAVAKIATDPATVYKNPYLEYERFVEAHGQGERNYSKYPAMILMADKAKDEAFTNQLLREFSTYVSSLPRKERYTKERIEMWAPFTFGTNSRVFKFFYKDGHLIDKVMDKKGFALSIVDKSIQAEIVIPFFYEHAKNSKIAMSGPYLTNGDGQPFLKTDSSEADWARLTEIIQKKFSKDYTERNVLSAKIEWYKRHWNYYKYAMYSLLKLRKYPPNDLSEFDQAYNVNEICWETFMRFSDRKMIDEAAHWMKKVIDQRPNVEGFMIDTYANLLYKSGKVQEAIYWEEKAASITTGPFAIYQAAYKQTVEKMKKGEPTNDGAVWGYK